MESEQTKTAKKAVLVPQLKANKARFQLLHPDDVAPKSASTGKALWTHSGLDVADLYGNLCQIIAVVAGEDLSVAQSTSQQQAMDPRVAQTLASVGIGVRHSAALEKKKAGWSKQAARAATILKRVLLMWRGALLMWRGRGC